MRDSASVFMAMLEYNSPPIWLNAHVQFKEPQGDSLNFVGMPVVEHDDEG